MYFAHMLELYMQKQKLSIGSCKLLRCAEKETIEKSREMLHTINIIIFGKNGRQTGHSAGLRFPKTEMVGVEPTRPCGPIAFRVRPLTTT